jgi:hypothetical protein
VNALKGNKTMNEDSICIAKIGLTIFAIIGMYIYTLRDDVKRLERTVERLDNELFKIRIGK